MVITDRLHGMIFCAITETNCIVLDSKSPKLRGCYEWISHLGYIRFVSNTDELESTWTIMKTKPNVFDNCQILEKMQELSNDMVKAVKNKI